MTRKEQRNQAGKEYGRKNPYHEYLGAGSSRYDYAMPAEHFIKGSEWADAHPNWHKADEELPPRMESFPAHSIDVFVTNGVALCQGFYSYIREEWQTEGLFDGNEVTHWMLLPELPKED